MKKQRGTGELTVIIFVLLSFIGVLVYSIKVLGTEMIYAQLKIKASGISVDSKDVLYTTFDFKGKIEIINKELFHENNEVFYMVKFKSKENELKDLTMKKDELEIKVREAKESFWDNQFSIILSEEEYSKFIENNSDEITLNISILLLANIKDRILGKDTVFTALHVNYSLDGESTIFSYSEKDKHVNDFKQNLESFRKNSLNTISDSTMEKLISGEYIDTNDTFNLSELHKGNGYLINFNLERANLFARVLVKVDFLRLYVE